MKSAPLIVILLAVAVAASALAQQRKPVAGHLDELPSLQISKDQALSGLDEYKDLQLRASLTPGIENWWSHTNSQQLVYSLKCVKDKVIAMSLEIPGVIPPEKSDLLIQRTIFAMKALANADKEGGWDQPPGAGLLGRTIGQITRPPYEPTGHKSGNNLVMFVYFPQRNAIQISVLPIELVQNFDLSGI